MLIPAPKLFWATAVLALAGLGVSFFDVFAGVWLTGLGALTAIAIVDAILALRLPVPKAERQTPGSLPLGVDQDIAIRDAVDADLASDNVHVPGLHAVVVVGGFSGPVERPGGRGDGSRQSKALWIHALDRLRRGV